MFFPYEIYFFYIFKIDITTERCFSLLINLLENNPSHQRLFYQSGRVHQLALFFRIGSVDEECWSEQKATNVRLLLLVRDKRMLFLIRINNSFFFFLCICR
jgi:hypothetical protein